MKAVILVITIFYIVLFLVGLRVQMYFADCKKAIHGNFTEYKGHGYKFWHCLWLFMVFENFDLLIVPVLLTGLTDFCWLWLFVGFLALLYFVTLSINIQTS